MQRLPRKPLRLWPGVVIASLPVAGRFVVPLVVPDARSVGDARRGVVGGLAIVVWWLFFSRAPWSERLGAIVLMIVAVFATKPVVHPSIAERVDGEDDVHLLHPVPEPRAGRRGRWPAVVSPTAPRRASMVAAILLACGAWTLVRTGGISGDAGSDFHWRWTPTPEERLLAQAATSPKPLPPAPARRHAAPRQPDGARRGVAACRRPAAAADGSDTPRRQPTKADRCAAAGRPEPPAEWPGFRGPERDGVVRGVRIETDWSQVAAGRAVAPADRTGLVVVRGPRRSPLHAGAARRRRDRRLLQRDHRRAGVAASRRGAVLGVEWRRRSARDADAQQRPRLHARRDRNPERARRRHRRRRLVAQRGDRHRREDPGLGLRELAAGGRRPRHRRRRRAGSPPTTSPPAQPRWSGPTGGGELQLAASGDDRRRRADPAAAAAPARSSVAPADGTVLWEHAWDRASPSCSRR